MVISTNIDLYDHDVDVSSELVLIPLCKSRQMVAYRVRSVAYYPHPSISKLLLLLTQYL